MNLQESQSFQIQGDKHYFRKRSKVNRKYFLKSLQGSSEKLIALHSIWPSLSFHILKLCFQISHNLLLSEALTLSTPTCVPVHMHTTHTQAQPNTREENQIKSMRPITSLCWSNVAAAPAGDKYLDADFMPKCFEEHHGEVKFYVPFWRGAEGEAVKSSPLVSVISSSEFCFCFLLVNAFSWSNQKYLIHRFWSFH